MKKNCETETDMASRSLKRKRRKRSKKSIFLVIGVSVFVIYVVVVFTSQQIQISDKKEQLASVTEALQLQEIKNNEIKKSLESSANENSEYIERLARINLDFVRPSERVFINVTGS